MGRKKHLPWAIAKSIEETHLVSPGMRTNLEAIRVPLEGVSGMALPASDLPSLALVSSSRRNRA